jgi:hypothetical protein
MEEKVNRRQKAMIAAGLGAASLLVALAARKR